MNKQKKIKLPEILALQLENLAVREELLQTKIQLLQRGMSEIETAKKNCIFAVKEELQLSGNFEIDLASRVVMSHLEEREETE